GVSVRLPGAALEQCVSPCGGGIVQEKIPSRVKEIPGVGKHSQARGADRSICYRSEHLAACRWRLSVGNQLARPATVLFSLMTSCGISRYCHGLPPLLTA